MYYGKWWCEFDLTDATAFVYKITFTELDLHYIGAKKIYDIHLNETNWRDYNSSSKKVNELLSEGHVAKFEILSVHCDWSVALDCEDALLRENSVIHNKKYLNAAYGGRAGAFTGKKHTTASIELMKLNKTYKHTDIQKKKISEARKAYGGTPHTQETKDKLSATLKGRKKPKGFIPHAKKNASLYHTPAGNMTSTEAALYFNCSRNTVLSRAKNTNCKWSLWYKL